MIKITFVFKNNFSSMCIDYDVLSLDSAIKKAKQFKKAFAGSVDPVTVDLLYMNMPLIEKFDGI